MEMPAYTPEGEKAEPCDAGDQAARPRHHLPGGELDGGDREREPGEERDQRRRHEPEHIVVNEGANEQRYEECHGEGGEHRQDEGQRGDAIADQNDRPHDHAEQP